MLSECPKVRAPSREQRELWMIWVSASKTQPKLAARRKMLIVSKLDARIGFFYYYHHVRERTATETIQEEVDRALELLPSNAKYPHHPIKTTC
jgi:hypothetical protein